MSEILIGPLQGESMITSGLDYYKATMSQVVHNYHPDTEVTFRLNNRGVNLLSDYIDTSQLQSRVDRFSGGWKPEETNILAGHERIDGDPLFGEVHLDFLQENELPPVVISQDEDTGELTAETTGDWATATFWETVVMAETNELYFETYIRENNLDIHQVYAEGDRRLDEKIAILQSRPDIKFADFGTRRRFSYRWHHHVLNRLVTECPNNIIGTSNIELADEFGITLIGTYAHELPMAYAALAEHDGLNPMEGQQQQLKDWEELYGNNVSTALTDTFGTDLFFSDFTKKQAQHWRSMRHDSADPFEFGDRLIDFYESYDIDPKTKTVVFSDGLDISEIVKLQDEFGGKMNVVFGWGTDLTNDLGLKALQIVMKLVDVSGLGTVKLSDVEEKYTGAVQDIERYKEAKQQRINQRELV